MIRIVSSAHEADLTFRVSIVTKIRQKRAKLLVFLNIRMNTNNLG